ncbi:MAG: PKD domain-containing protein [Thermoplasmatales archaeon]|nr:PKD domain-containing protein [Thermoplasmatales archaeon]
MKCVDVKKLIIFVIVIALFLGIFNNFGVANQEDQNISYEKIYNILSHKESRNEKLEQSVENLLRNYAGEELEYFEKSSIRDFAFVDDKVRLEIILSSEDELGSLIAFDENIKIENHYKSLVQVLIPINLIDSLSEEEYVQCIRSPVKPHPLDIMSEGVTVIGANLIHNEGIYGSGVKIAIIDLGFQNYYNNPELPSARIAEVQSFRADGDIECGEKHGCACAEIVLDVAPQADLYLYNFDTISELNNAVSHAISVGVDIISFSVGFICINDYDGIGYSSIGDVCGIVDNARNNGILFITSIGNSATRHYEGYFTDGDGDGFHEFNPPFETLVLEYIPTGGLVHLGLSWNDWPSSNQDYNLYLFDSNLNLVGWSENTQSGTQPPVESIGGYVPYGDNYQVVIQRYSATQNVHFELYSFTNNFQTSNHPESSLTCPADAFGSMTIGATYWQDDSLESFSSRGPTNDGRTKPDVTAPDGVSTYAYPNPFYGTSASAPHTAGAAALLKSVDFSLTANELQNKLESTALDLGPGGKDNLYGSGRINVWAAFNTINQPPNADFTYEPLDPTTQDSIFFNSTSYDPDGSIVNWTWDFGDGNVSYDANTIHQYGDDGIYTVMLSVTDNHGATDTFSDDVTVLNNPPTAHIDSINPNPAIYGETVFFDGHGTDTDGTIFAWQWNSSMDGLLSTQPSFNTSAISLGMHTISFKVKDDDGEWSQDATQILIINDPPIANFIHTPSIPTVNDVVQFNDTSIDLDGTIVNWTWDFGDGNVSYDVNTIHQYSDNLTYNVTLTVTDNDGDSSSITKQIVTKETYIIPLDGNETTIDLQNETDIIVAINTTASTIINISKYSGNPTGEDISGNITSIGKYVDVEVENESTILWPVNITIYYTQDDLNNSNIDESQLLGIYFWNDATGEWQLYNNTGVNTTYNQSGYEGYCWVNAWHLTPLALGGDNESPSKVTGLTVTDAKDGKLSLSWDEATDNIEVEHYRIYRDNEFLINRTTTSHQDTGLTNDQSYTYQVLAVDTSGNGGEKSNSESGTPTKSGGGGNGGNGGGDGNPPPPPQNSIPIANAGGPYYSFVDSELEFDGTQSSDSDGNITSWFWVFGDGTNGTGEIITHIYSSPGTYTVILIVSDDVGAEGSYETTAVISQPNRIPSTPDVDGPQDGTQNTEYTYTAVSTDEDNDTIQYHFDWGDGTTNTTEFLPNGTAATQTHIWTVAGKYTISVQAYDNQTPSDITRYTVLIDAHIVGDIGYITDDDADSIYDTFHGKNIETELGQEDGKYLIDTNGDGDWNYTYDLVDGLATYKRGEDEIPWIMIVVIVIAIAVIAIIVYLYKKEYF